LFQHSFPQPEELEDEDGDEDEGGAKGPGVSAPNGKEAATTSTPPALQVPRASGQKDHVLVGDEGDEFVDAPSEPEDEDDGSQDAPPKPSRSSTKSFVTASSTPLTADEAEAREDASLHGDQGQAQASGLQVSQGHQETGPRSLGKRPVSSVESHTTPASTGGQTSVDAGSTSSLIRKADMKKAPAPADVDSKAPAKGILARVKRRSENALSRSDPPPNDAEGAHVNLVRKKSNLRNLVKFDIPEDSKRAKMHLAAKQAQMTFSRAPTKLRRHRLRDGLVVKMERMLVRVDAAGEVPDDFDENVNQRVNSRVKDKWREYMIVCRHNHTDNADFVLQLYQTRVCDCLQSHAMLNRTDRPARSFPKLRDKAQARKLPMKSHWAERRAKSICTLPWISR